MATLEQANIYNEVRGNEAWTVLLPARAAALLNDAEDYIRGTYPIRSNLTVDDQRIFDSIVCRLASIFQTNPPQVAATAPIKKESKELTGLKKSVEYADTPSDPYPYITAIVRGLSLSSLVSTGLYQGAVTA